MTPDEVPPIPNALIPNPITVTCKDCGQPFTCDVTSIAAKDQICGSCYTSLPPDEVT